MNIKQSGKALLSLALLTSGLLISAANPAYADNDRKVKRLLTEMGLDPVECGSLGSEISVYDQDDRRTCARATSAYPAGSYFFDRDTYSIRPLGVANSQLQPPAMPIPTAPVPAATPSPAILLSSNPSLPVDPVVSAQISASLMARGLSPMTCSANPGVVVFVGGYMACAYPTPAYPAGRYTMVLR